MESAAIVIQGFLHPFAELMSVLVIRTSEGGSCTFLRFKLEQLAFLQMFKVSVL